MNRSRATVRAVAGVLGAVLVAAGCSGADSVGATEPEEPEPPPPETCVHTEPTEATGRWRVQNSGVSGRISTIQFLDSEVGRAVQMNRNGRELTHLRTSNGGSTWCARKIVSSSLDLGHFLEHTDADVGFTGGQSCTVYKTLDGGESWRGTPLCDSRWLLEMDVAPDGTLWVGGGHGLLFVSTDGGDRWSQREVTGLDQPVDGIHFVTSQIGMLLENEESDYLYRTDDGGETWSSLESPAVGSRPRDVSFADAETGVIVGTDGLILRSTDAGRTWQEVESGTSNDINRVDFGTNGFGIAVGNAGTVVVTDDGGATWSLEETDLTQSLAGVSVLDPERAWISGTGGFILTRVGG